MGKPGGFLEYRRRDPGYRPREERLLDFREVERRLDEPGLREQAARCMDCGTPFCHAFGCPLANVIPEVNDLAYHGRWAEAADLLLSTNNFPEFTGRICPALCEAACVLGIHDQAVTIRQLELAVIERAFAGGLMVPRPPATRTGARVAVCGSGPAGLAVADVLNRAGVSVTVYDGAKSPGGILRYGIPDFKLDKAIVGRRIRLMQDEGVVFEMQAALGEDISARFLQSRFQAIVLSGGARKPRDLAVPGRELAGVIFAMDYLTHQNRLVSGEETAIRPELNAKGRTVAVLGGGDTGSDCLGTALRQGAKKVYQLEIMPRPPDERPPSTPWPQWPNILRQSSSHQEGGERRWGVMTTAFLGESGRLRVLRGVEVEWTPPAPDQRPAPRPRPGTEFELEADLAIIAMGFTGPAKSKLADDLGVQTDERGGVLVDADHMSSVPGVFACGDMVRGASLVVRAIADGRAAAEGILRFLGAAP